MRMKSKFRIWFQAQRVGLMILLVVLCSIKLYSQQTVQVITGSVFDSTSNALEGVSVLEKGTGKGVVTDKKGEFRISVSQDAILQFKMTGFKEEEIALNGQTNLTVTLQQQSGTLSDVVVVGYGTQKRSDLTGAIATVKGKDLSNRITSNPLDALSGKVAGLNIYNNSGRPGGGISINLRGFNSISASNSPLFVIDGVIGADVQMLNPNDIESLDVLKDASSTAIYGSRGANGVVIITTKKAKSGDFNLNYTGNISVSQVAKKIDVLESNEWLDWFKRAWAYDPDRGPLPDLHKDFPDLFNESGNPIYNTNWQDAATRNAISNRHFLSITQGTQKSKSGLFLGYEDEQGIITNTWFKKYNARYTNEMTIKSWLTVGGELAYNQTRTNRVDDYRVGAENATRMMLEMLPIFPIKYPNGKWSTLNDFGYAFNGDHSHYYSGIYPAENPVRLLNEVTNLFYNDQVLVNLYGNVKLAEGLEFKTSYAAQIFSSKNNNYVGKDLLDLGVASGGYAGVNQYRNVYWQSENYLTYNRLIGSAHHFNALVGASWTKTSQESVGASATGFSTDYFQFNNLAAGSVLGTPQSNYYDFSLNSYYGRINYSYQDKYLLTLTGRYDGSSKFGNKNKYAFFPSGALGWILSKEKFLENSRLISFLKLRGSYGITGNSEISPYSALATVGTYTISLNDQIVKGTGPGNVPNPELKWEQTAQFDGGVDVRLLHDRLSLTVDYYKKKTTNLLLNVPISTVSGYSSVTTNIGSMQNTGVELTANGDILRNRNFTWNLGVLFSTNENKILALGETDADVYPGPNFLGQTNILQVGRPVGNFWGFKRVGTWGEKEVAEAALYGKKPGDIKRLDVNGDHVFDNSDAMVLGNMFPKYEMSFTTSFTYKNWNLTADVQVRQGNKIMNITTLTMEDRQYYANSYGTILQEAWTLQNQNTQVPSLRFAHVDPWGTDLPFFMDSRWVEDGSFIRGKSINLSYTFAEKFTQKIGVKGLRLYGNVQNFFLITSFRGYDPEVSTFGGTFAQGIEFYATPRPRTYSFGINANF